MIRTRTSQENSTKSLPPKLYCALIFMDRNLKKGGSREFLVEDRDLDRARSNRAFHLLSSFPTVQTHCSKIQLSFVRATHLVVRQTRSREDRDLLSTCNRVHSIDS